MLQTSTCLDPALVPAQHQGCHLAFLEVGVISHISHVNICISIILYFILMVIEVSINLKTALPLFTEIGPWKLLGRKNYLFQPITTNDNLIHVYFTP